MKSLLNVITEKKVNQNEMQKACSILVNYNIKNLLNNVVLNYNKKNNYKF